uniref:Uncharacterized protein n=1 Tax=Meloidogyne hapla TaxID=6305 RepID=A0A1I8AYZ9_MELHA
MRSFLKTLIVLWPPLIGQFILMIPNVVPRTVVKNTNDGLQNYLEENTENGKSGIEGGYVENLWKNDGENIKILKGNVQEVSPVVSDKYDENERNNDQQNHLVKENTGNVKSGIVENAVENNDGEIMKKPKDNESLKKEIEETEKKLEVLKQEELNLGNKAAESNTTEEEKDSIAKQIDQVKKEELSIVNEVKTEIKTAEESEKKEEGNNEVISIWQSIWQSFWQSLNFNNKQHENDNNGEVIEKSKLQETEHENGLEKGSEKEKANGIELKKEKDLQKPKGQLKPEVSKNKNDEKLTKKGIGNPSSTIEYPPNPTISIKDQVISVDNKKVKWGEKHKETPKENETVKNNGGEKKKGGTEKSKPKIEEINGKNSDKTSLAKSKTVEEEGEKTKVNEKTVDTNNKTGEKRKLEDNLTIRDLDVTKKDNVGDNQNIVKQSQPKGSTQNKQNGEAKKRKREQEHKSGRKVKKQNETNSPNTHTTSDESSYEESEEDDQYGKATVNDVE